MRCTGTQQGDIVRITLDPTAGSKKRGTRPVLVLSNQDFNTGGARVGGTHHPARKF